MSQKQIYKNNWKDYSRLGLIPIPAPPDMKGPTISWADFQQEPPCSDEYADWEEKFADWNVWVLLGDEYAVIDPDHPEAEQFIQSLNLPECPTSDSGNKSAHRWFKTPYPIEPIIIKKDKKTWLELRTGQLGMMAPPSIHPETKRPYKWRDGYSPSEIPIPYLPIEIYNEIKKLSENGSNFRPADWAEELLQGIPNGGRNVGLAQLAGRYIAKGLSRDEILPILEAVNSKSIPPKSAREVQTVLDSVFKTHRRNHPLETNTEDKEKKSSVELKLTTISEIYEYPDLFYLIEDMIPEGTVDAIGGYTGVGKSVVVLDLIKSCATGKPFIGKYAVNKTGPVLLVDEETPRSLLRDRIRKMKFDPSWAIYFLHFQDIKIDKEPVFKALMEKIKEVKPVLVVFDSLIRIHRKREKESEEMAQVIDALRKIANWGTTVIIIHHHKKGGGPLTEKLRGSSDIPGGIDVEFALTPEKEGSDILLFQSVKTRIKPFLPIRIKLNITDDTAAVECCGSINETILDMVVGILSGETDFLTVKQIIDKLVTEKFDDFKEYEIRKALKEGERLGILKSGETKVGKSKATTYKVNE